MTRGGKDKPVKIERAVRAELISRTWITIAQVEELRADIEERLAVTATRTKLIDALGAATSQLLVLAEMLLPFAPGEVQKVREIALAVVNGDVHPGAAHLTREKKQQHP